MPRKALDSQPLQVSQSISAALRFCFAFLCFGFAGSVYSQPDYPGAKWVPPACTKYYTSGNGHHFVVIHDMEGYYESSVSYLNRCDKNTNGNFNVSASVYYLVNGLQNGSSATHAENNPGDAPPGDITQSVRESNYAWHASCWNTYMFGTEHEGFASDPAWYSEAMYQASAALQRHLCSVVNPPIPMDRNHIIGHNEWQNAAWKTWMASNWPQIDTTCNNHTDPGPYWNWGHFMQLITNGNPPVITSAPQDVSVLLNSNASFTVAATGTGVLRYQWQFNQTNLAGATSTRLTISDAQLADAGGYSVVVSNTGGATISAPGFLSVVGPLTNSPGAVPAPAGIVDWWPGDGNISDIVGTYNGTPENGFSYAPGRQSRALHFDGLTSYVALNAPSLNVPWTLSFWVNRQNAPGASAAIASDGTYTLKLEQYNGTRQVGITRLGVADYTLGYTVPVNTWVHLAMVGTASQTLLYANGVLQGSLATNVPLPRKFLGVGYVASSSRFVDYLLGSLDEIMIFNRALSVGEIGSIYSAGSAGLYRAPEFTSIATPENGQVQIGLVGLTGKSLTLYSSTNFLNWTPQTSINNPSGTVQLLVPFDANAPMKFYRVSQP